MPAISLRSLGLGLDLLRLIFVSFMLIHKDLSFLPRFRNAIVTIGTFDGVHAGHRKIIEQLQREAAQVNGETVIITFHPHPRQIVREGQSPVPLLTTLAEKTELLQAIGIDHLAIIPFDAAFADQSAEEYIVDFLFEKFHPHTVITGYDHKFGKGRAGDYQLLETYGRQLRFTVKEIPEHILNEVTISSTKIRHALLHTDIATANRYLSYPYFFEGFVTKGNQLGRTIGYATANLEIEDAEKLVPGNGVYAVEAERLPGELSMARKEESMVNREYSNHSPFTTHHLLKGMMNIGLRPTVDGTKRTIEVNLFDFNEDIYGSVLRVYIRHYLRGEVKFNGLNALKDQLAKDKEQAIELLK